jgi:dihydrofolate synthase/folylpolyglutamate synthase
VEVPGESLARVVSQLRPHVDRLRAQRPEAAPTFFDATTAAALLLFAEARVDRVLLEVGLGGRLDSTNAVEPCVTCVTQIELEHTQILGNTLAEIAAEKAGILKPGVPCVIGVLAAQAEAVVRDRAGELGVALFAQGEHFDLEIESSPDGSGRTRLRYAEKSGLALELDLPIAGAHLAGNVGLSLACIRSLRAHDERSLARAALAGLRTLRLPGRVELAGREPRVVIDSAHTAASARALASALATLGVRDAELVLSVSKGKALREMLVALVPCVASMTLTQADPERSLATDELAQAVRTAAPALSLRVVPDPREAVRAALGAAGREGAVVVAGSVYLAGIAREVVREASFGPRSQPGRAPGPRA